VRVSRYRRSEDESLDDLRVALQGRVFHVSKLATLPQILADGCIRANRDRSPDSAFGDRANGFFRKRGCVSVFDYRATPTKELEDFRSRCYPFAAAGPEGGGIAIYLLSPAAYDRLVPWTRWREEEAWSEIVVPHVEAGYPDSIPLDLVEDVIALELLEGRDLLTTAIRRARAKRGVGQHEDPSG
jgi:hypothetical protein